MTCGIYVPAPATTAPQANVSQPMPTPYYRSRIADIARLSPMGTSVCELEETPYNLPF